MRRSSNFAARTCTRCGKEKKPHRFCRNCMRIDRERDGLPPVHAGVASDGGGKKTA